MSTMTTSRQWDINRIRRRFALSPRVAWPRWCSGRALERAGGKLACKLAVDLSRNLRQGLVQIVGQSSKKNTPPNKQLKLDDRSNWR